MARTVELHGYQTIARVRGQRVLSFQRFGGSTGEWLLLAHEPLGDYFLYKGRYGSCHKCDHYWGEFANHPGSAPIELVDKFVQQYPPFLQITAPVMRSLVEDEQLGAVLPLNVRDLPHLSYAEAQREIEIAVRLEEDLPVDGLMALQVRDLELQTRLLNRLGNERFVEDLGAELLAKDAWGALYRTPTLKVWRNNRLVENRFVFVKVRDASTNRDYLLRVPPNMERPKQAIAWTFGLNEDEYNPTVQT